MILSLVRDFKLIFKPIFGLAAIALASSIAIAQQAPAPPPDTAAPPAAPIERQPPSDPMGSEPMHPGAMPGRHDVPPNVHDHGGMRESHESREDEIRKGYEIARMRESREGSMDEAFHIAPPGMWWKNPMIVQRLTLTPEQTKKMDDIFQKSRLQLIDLKASVERQQVLLEPMLSANPLDSSKVLAQIDKVAQSRADLEKAHARMLLGIRTVLTPDQWTKLNDRRFGPPSGPGAPEPSGAPGQPAGGTRSHGMRAPANTSNLVDPIDQL